MIEFRINEKTRSLNESFRGDWRPRAAVAKRQRAKAMQACPKWPGGPLLMVRLTRVSPGTLDSEDNLRGALKHIRDGVASRLKFDDASPLVEWQYHQAKGEAEVVVQIWKTGGEAPPLPVGRGVELNSKAMTKAQAATGKRLRAPRDAGTERPRTPRPAYAPPSGMGMHLHGQDVPGPILRSAIAAREAAMRAVPRASRTNSLATKALEPSNAAEHLALLAAQEAEDTFAPGHEEPETCRVPECDERRVAHGYCAVHALQAMP